MNLSGEESIAAPPAAVWEALIDPVVLARLIPGCRRMTGNPAQGYDIAAAREVAGTELHMTGRIDLSDIRPAEGVTLVAHGTAGAPGGARGTARIRLIPDGTGTRLAWDIEATTEGTLARIPDFVAKIAASRLADGFVRRFKAAVEGTEPSPRRRGLLGRLTG